MFLGLKGPFKDQERFLEPTTRALFIPEGKSGWKYYGLYVIQRKPENDLTMEEWRALPEYFKDGKEGYCNTTLSKRLGGARHEDLMKKNRPVYDANLLEIRTDYDRGELRVPCVVLQCVSYSEQFVKELAAAKSVKKTPSPTPSADEPASLGKRKRGPRHSASNSDHGLESGPSSSPQRPRLT